MSHLHASALLEHARFERHRARQIASEAKRRDLAGEPDVDRLIRRVRGGSMGAYQELCDFMVEAARPYVMRSLTSREITEQIEESIIFVMDAICMDALRVPESLPVFARVVLRHQLFDLNPPVH